MDSFLFITLFAGLGVGYTLLGFYASRHVNTTDDYFLAGRDLGFIPVTFSLIATQLGGGMLLGTSEKAYQFGVYGIMYTLGMSIGFMLLGISIAARLRALNVATTAEIFQTRYNSPGLKQFASLLSVASMFGILVGQVVGSRMLLAGLGLDSELLLMLFWLFIIVYTMVGGLRAVVVTDVFQVLFIIVVFTGIFGYSALPGMFSWSVPQLWEVQNQFGALAVSRAQLVTTLLMPVLFSLIEQDLAQRFFAARTQRIAMLSAVGASVFMLLFAGIPLYLGMMAQLMELPIAAGSSPLIPVIRVLMGETVVAFAVCGIIAAITSTADSLLCAISSNLAQDFTTPIAGIADPVKRSQIITCVVGIAALVASYLVAQDVIDILTGSYTLSVSCLLVPLVVAYYRTQLHKRAAIYSVAAGGAGFIFFMFYPVAYHEFITLAFSGAGYLLGEFIAGNDQQ